MPKPKLAPESRPSQGEPVAKQHSPAPAIRVTLNGRELATVSTEGLNLLCVNIHGNRINADFASVDVMGGVYGAADVDTNKHLLWVADQALFPGDVISVILLEHAQTSHQGKTIDEAFPDASSLCGPQLPLERTFERLALEPLARSGYVLTITSPAGETTVAKTLPEDFTFGFYVIWDWTRPESARVNASSNSLQSVQAREPGTTHATFVLNPGERTILRVDALNASSAGP